MFEEDIRLINTDVTWCPSSGQVTWTANAAGTLLTLNMGEDSVVTYLPLSHVAAQVNDMWICLKFAGTTYFAQPDALKVDIIFSIVLIEMHYLYL